LKICGKKLSDSHGPPSEAATSSCAGEMNLDSSGQTHSPLLPIEQGVILVTEHNAELNAQARTGYCQLPASTGVCILSRMISHGPDDRDMAPEECRTWIQTGLALTPFFVARQGHPNALVSPYDQRSVPILTSARACFEQGSLPSLLALLLVMVCSKRSELLLTSVDLWYFMDMVVPKRRFPLVWRAMFAWQVNFLWRFEDLLHAHPQFGNILWGALLPSVMIESLRW